MSGLDIINNLRDHFHDAGFVISKIHPKSSDFERTTIDVRHKISKNIVMQLHFQIENQTLLIGDRRRNDDREIISISLDHNMTSILSSFCNNLFDALIEEDCLRDPDDRLDEFDTTAKILSHC